MVGNLGFYSEIFVIVFTLFLGTIMDFLGRKWPTIIGFWIAGALLIALPYGTSVFPYLYCVR